MATISHKKNYNVSIRNTEGTDVNDHDQKAALLQGIIKDDECFFILFLCHHSK
jgi:hypothetical protein